MDLPGFGYSELPEGDISIEYYASWVFRLLDALGIETAAVVGNSMGGFIAAEMAIRSPERVQRLAVVSAAVFWQGYRRAQPLVGLARLSDALRRPRADALDRRRRDAAAPARVGARDGRLPLSAPDRARSSPTSWCAARAAPTASCPRSRRWPTTRSRRSCRRSAARR